ncbi:hypothetical protein LWI29_027721 [Acer saccharum]|uniref:GDSL esterase/lipase n=1 Tax=Acer saccharum TaxID=4024 RepID=A0AA39VEQ5_ACESA|nr:hypothetical protein LWI29_027721 [Acer saccharum]
MMSFNNQRVRFPSLAIMLVVLMIMLSCSPDHHGIVVGDPLVPALFVFGDSLVDDGNNNFLSSIAKANYYPYGVDFDFGVPTGRFSNGKNFIDFIARMMGVAYPPPFADPNTVGTRLLGGVNYASAAAGILDESGRHYALYSVGLRKFFVAGIGPLGCIPNQRASRQAPQGRCVDSVNQMLGTYNEGLKSVVDQLNKRPGAVFAYGNSYGAAGDILNNPEKFELASLVLDDGKHNQDEWQRSHGNELGGVPMEVSWENGRLGLRVDAYDVGFDRLID